MRHRTLWLYFASLASRSRSIFTNVAGNDPAQVCEHRTNPNYKYEIPEHERDCYASSANAACHSCRLWTAFGASQEACQSSDQWCRRRDDVTLMLARGLKEHYLVVPNAPNMGLEDWQRLGEDFWDAAWREITWVAAAEKPSWTPASVALVVNPSRARTQHQFHGHVEGLLETWRALLDSRTAPPGLPEWPRAAWVDIVGDQSRWAYLFRDESSQDRPGKAQPFHLWAANRHLVDITGFGEEPEHAVGLLVTRDPGDCGWFVILTRGSPEYLIYHDKGVVLDDGTPGTQGGHRLQSDE